MSSPVSPELSAKIAGWRLRVAEGTITQEELKEAIIHLRQNRLTAASAAAPSKRGAAKVAAPAASDLLDELDAM